MKKTIISLALAFLGIANLYAVKAKPGIAKIMLADGTVACATLHGDETFPLLMLLDGTPLRETQDGKYEKITAEELEHPKAGAFSAKNITRASEIGTVSQAISHIREVRRASGTPGAVSGCEVPRVRIRLLHSTITLTERREKLCLRLIKKCLSPTRLTGQNYGKRTAVFRMI